MRRWGLILGVLTLALVPMRLAAGQAAPAIDVPERYRGSDIERALQAKDWNTAETRLAAEIDKAPRASDLLTLLGRVFLIDRKPLNAAIAFKKADAIGPLDEASRYALALAYVSMKRGDWARPELERLRAGNPHNPLYQYWLGRLDYDDGLYSSAVAHFQEAIARDANFVRAYDNLGLSFEALNQPDEALAAYRRAVDLNRQAKTPEGWPPLNLGILLRTRGDAQEAEAMFREALKYDNQLPQAHYQLGALLDRNGRSEEAVTELTTAAALDADYPEPHYALMRIYQRLGRTADADRARATFERLHDARREVRQP